MLGRSYTVLERYPQALDAFKHALDLRPKDAQSLADYADAMGMANGRKLTGEPEKLIMQAVKLDPRNVKALALAGTIAFNRNDFKGAVSYWEQAVSIADPASGYAQQLAGALALHPGFDGVFCLPGTHSKWVHVSAGEVVSFQTYMTGEMFSLLSTQSVLRHSLTAEGWDDAAFDDGLSDALSRPDRIAARLFSLRAEGLLHAMTAPQARARLSGLLIGIELAGAKPYWLGQSVKLIGAQNLSALYARALGLQGLQAETEDATACTLAGLSALYAKLKD